MKNFTKTILLAAISCATPAQSQSWLPYFGNSHFGFSTGSHPNSTWPKAVRLADLDADTDLDAVIAQGGATGFSVLINAGNGYYGSPVNYPTGFSSEDVLVEDFTGDGILDVVAANTGEFGDGTSVSLFPGTGNGTFGTGTAYTVGTSPTGLVSEDFNSDNLPDLAVANHGWGNDSTISILFNSAAGFLPAQSITVSPGPFQLAAGYIDNDSMPDLVVAHSGQRITVLFNSILGLQPDTVYDLQAGTAWGGDGGYSVAIGDIDQDLDTDILYTSARTWNGTTGQIAIALNNGVGQIDSVQRIDLNAYSSGATSLQLADLNNDNLPDIVANNGSGSTGDGYRVILNQGAGNFSPVTVRPGGQWTRAVAVGDVYLDGAPDVVTLDDYSMQITVHRNLGNGQFATPTLHTAGVPTMAGLIEAGDMDNDGDLDLVTSANRRMAVSAPVVIFRNSGNATFTTGQQIAPAGVQVKLRDINADGFLDLLYIGGTGVTGYAFSTAFNQAGASFATPTTWQVGVCAPDDIDAADLDNDGDLDVVAAGGCSGEIQISYFNDSTNTFGQAVNYSVGTYPGALALGDFNNDQRIDIAAGNSEGFDLLLADSLGGFQSPQPFLLAQGPWDLLAADLNDDGILDIASCNYGVAPGGYNMTVRHGIGDGTFDSVQTLPAAYSPDLANVSGITCGDIDNDYDLDLMVGNNATNDMSIYLNQGNGTYSAALRAGLYYSARSPIFADFNGDGHCEVAALVSLPPGGFSSAIVVLAGTNSGSRVAGSGTATVSAPEELLAEHTPLQAWPNPFSDYSNISVKLQKPGKVTLTLYNTLGQKVMQPMADKHFAAGQHTITLYKEQLPKGAYFVQVETNGNVQSAKLIIE